MLKNVVLAACFLTGLAHAAQATVCSANLDEQPQTFAIEAKHVVDICTTNGEVVKTIKIGDPENWRLDVRGVNNERSEIVLSPRVSGSLTNMIVSTTDKNGLEKRYGVRLVSIDPDKRAGQRLKGKAATQ